MMGSVSTQIAVHRIVRRPKGNSVCSGDLLLVFSDATDANIIAWRHPGGIHMHTFIRAQTFEIEKLAFALVPVHIDLWALNASLLCFHLFHPGPMLTQICFVLQSHQQPNDRAVLDDGEKVKQVLHSGQVTGTAEGPTV